MTDEGNGTAERVRRRDLIGGAAFRGVVIGLSAGIALRVLGQPIWAARILAWTCGLLVVFPVINITSVLIDEIRRRDWGFALIAVTVLGLLAYGLISRLL
ncbi:MAG TPA: hypothetical protein VFV78_05560 [Vicinamibacterales bacterium]|nr:hypothetical protein [Vicinamibacterales bacterium]